MTNKAERERLKQALGVENTTPEAQAAILLALHTGKSEMPLMPALSEAMAMLSRLDAALSPVGNLDWRNPLFTLAEYLDDVESMGGTVERAKHAALLKIIMPERLAAET